MAVVARVAWHSAGRTHSVPVSLVFGGERVALQVVERAWVGSVQAGEAVTQQFVVEDTRHRVFRIRVRNGVVTVELLTPS